MAVGHRLGEAAVDAAGVAYGGEAGVQGVLDDLSHLHGPDGQGLARQHLGAQVGAPQVGVGVGEAGEDSPAADIDHAGVGGDTQAAAGAHTDDVRFLHEHRAVGERVGPGAIDDHAVVEGYGLSHGAILLQKGRRAGARRTAWTASP